MRLTVLALVQLLGLLQLIGAVGGGTQGHHASTAQKGAQLPTCSLANDTAYDTQHVAGVPAVPPLKLAPGTASAAACCSLCSAHAGCTYFTLWPNRTCALLASFGGPRVLVGAVSGSTVTKPAPISFAVHSDPGLLSALKALPRLPKPHFAWPVLPTGDVAVYTSDPYVHEFTRITGSISFSAEFANRDRTFLIVKAASTANASIGVHFWGLWRRGFPPGAPPTYDGPEAKAEMVRFGALMRNASTWIAEANVECGTAVRVGLVMLDVEHFRTQGNGSAWDKAITAKHTATFELTKQIFPGSEVDWFGRGGCHRGPPAGWWCGEGPDNFFTLQEPADAFSVTQYSIWEPGYRREAFRRTVTAVSAAASTGAPPGKPVIHTFISLGAGLKRSVAAFKAGASTGREYVDRYDYDTAYDFMAGQEINVAKYSQEPLLSAAGAPYNYSNTVIIYPSVFIHPNQIWHFLAYARGAAQVFTDTAVPSSAAGLPPAPHPPSPSPPAAANSDPPAPPGWRLFRGSCMNDNRNKKCGANHCCCADGSLIGETQCPAGSSRPACVSMALARCKALQNCRSFSLMGNMYQLWPFNNWSAVPNSEWDSYAMNGPAPPTPALKTGDALPAAQLDRVPPHKKDEMLAARDHIGPLKVDDFEVMLRAKAPEVRWHTSAGSRVFERDSELRSSRLKADDTPAPPASHIGEQRSDAWWTCVQTCKDPAGKPTPELCSPLNPQPNHTWEVVAPQVGGSLGAFSTPASVAHFMIRSAFTWSVV